MSVSLPYPASTAPDPTPDTAVLVINAGSSSLKFALYPYVAPHDQGDITDHPSLAVGQIDGLQPGGQLQLCPAGQTPQALPSPEDDTARYEVALQALQGHLHREAPQVRVVAVAHRIVHGGGVFRDPVLLDEAAVNTLARFNSLAPLHQPHNLAGVRSLQQAYPHLPQIGCFDTAFHADMPALEARYALPEALHTQGLRRYGFHGLSYQYLMQVLQRCSPRAQGRVLMAHLGSGASVCAARAGRSVATSMGFSALDGLVMGSRCGQLDPGIVLHLWRQGWSAAEVEALLYKNSGLRGVSGLSGDMRQLRQAAAEASAPHQAAAQQAIDLFAHRLRREAGGLIATLGGVDVLVFTGGIGEHDAHTRRTLVEGLAFLGLRLDEQANAQAVGDAVCPLHRADSQAEIWVIPTDEGRVAAQAAWAWLASTPQPA